MTDEKLQIIDSYWLIYREVNVHKDAEEFQLRETKRAFFSGAGMMFKFITSETLTDAPEVIDEALKLDIVQDELDEYGAAIDREIEAEGRLQ